MSKFEEITNKIVKFRDERDWKQFHNPKDLSISISIEASELLEIFQWKSVNAPDIMYDKEIYEKIEEEIADVMNYIFLLAYELDIDIEDAINKKIHKNNIKYPIDKCKGKSLKYDRL